MSLCLGLPQACRPLSLGRLANKLYILFVSVALEEWNDMLFSVSFYAVT